MIDLSRGTFANAWKLSKSSGYRRAPERPLRFRGRADRPARHQPALSTEMCRHAGVYKSDVIPRALQHPCAAALMRDPPGCSLTAKNQCWSTSALPAPRLAAPCLRRSMKDAATRARGDTVFRRAELSEKFRVTVSVHLSLRRKSTARNLGRIGGLTPCFPFTSPIQKRRHPFLIDVCRVSIRQSVPLIKAPVWVHIFEEWRIVILHVRFADTVIDGTVQSGDL